ncbi:MAG TPA: cellulase family glycosylhydrolase [Clostridiales bacterium]|nr:cellulase family glycosylhydrolase [Clostridiales bacterium]
MSIIKKITSIAVSAAIMASLSFSINTSTNTKVSAVVNSTNDDWLHVEGNKVMDMYGNEVWITGCNWFGFNVGSGVFDGVWSCNMHDAIKSIADRGLNFLRVPVSTQILNQWQNDEPDPAPPKVNEFTNPELDGMNSKQLFEQAVEWCKQYGIKIMIDIHSAETHSAGHVFNLWYTDVYTTEMMYESLEWFTDYWKDDDTILAIDIKNEPHGTADTPNDMAKWDDSTDYNNWKHVAETAGKKILAINPNLLIMVEGTEVYPKEGYDWTAPRIEWTTNTTFYHSTWWGGNLRGAREYPIDLGEHQNQLVYSPHDYGPLVFEQTWFYEGFTQETLMEDCWYDNWAYLHEEGIAPLLIGEWGGFMDGGDNEKWMVLLRDYLIEEKINHTFWCFNENSGDTGGLVYDNFSKWDEEKYALLKPALWQNDDGKFIGLDHQTPLGINGISLSEHYNTTPTTANGDVNSDGKVNSLDVALTKRYILNKTDSTAFSLANADFNSDNVIDSYDLKKISKIVLGA